MVSDFAVPVRSLKCYNGIDGERLEILSLYMFRSTTIYLCKKKKYCIMFLYLHINSSVENIFGFDSNFKNGIMAESH